MGYTCHWESPLGGITLASDGERLTGLWFDGQAHFGSTLGPGDQPGELPVFRQTAAWLETYFAGRKPDFTPPLALAGTPFRREVWGLLLDIPYGGTVTYGQMAQRMGQPASAARAVGGAVGRNPISLIIPCHRVVGAGGRLTGYAAGLARKKFLLALEGAEPAE